MGAINGILMGVYAVVLKKDNLNLKLFFAGILKLLV